MRRYNPEEVEGRWQQIWARESAFEVPNPDAAGLADDPPRTYVLEMLPYPSGELHMGHVKNYTLGDVVSRFKAAQGYNVLHPIGFDAFGLPAENYAIKHGVHPKESTDRNIKRMRSQLNAIGALFNWDCEVVTCNDDYYKWSKDVPSFIPKFKGYKKTYAKEKILLEVIIPFIL